MKLTKTLGELLETLIDRAAGRTATGEIHPHRHYLQVIDEGDGQLDWAIIHPADCEVVREFAGHKWLEYDCVVADAVETKGRAVIDMPHTPGTYRLITYWRGPVEKGMLL